MNKKMIAISTLSTVAALGIVMSQVQQVKAVTAVPRPDHVVVVMEENHSYSEIIGSSSAPYINSLANSGAKFTNSHGVEHPSQPNYLDIFSGSNQGVTSDTTPYTFTTTNNLGSKLIAAGLTFGGYSEDMPSVGYTGSNYNKYYRKHNPWVDFTNIPSSANMPFTSTYWPTDFSNLPTVSFVIPNQNDDMHDGTIAAADTWLKNNLDSYVQWAKTHNSLLIVQWDEDDNSANNQIPTIFVGPMVKQGSYSENINHYNVLRTIEDMYGLPYVGNSATAATISDVWQ
ncbi:MAG: alkaline phosphatase family protein [Tumebacillaceae bacterium]